MIGVKRIDYIRAMTVEEMAKTIIKLHVTDAYCKNECDDPDFACTHELDCCVRWLEEHVKRKVLGDD